MWLYEHLKMYLKFASPIVDLSFYKFDVPVLVYSGKETYEEQRGWYTTETQHLTEEECIRLCISYLEDYLTYEKYDLPAAKANAIEQMAHEKLSAAFAIYSIIVPALWW